MRAYQEANPAAYRTAFLSTIAFCGVGIIATWWAPNIDYLLSRDVVVQLGRTGDEEESEKKLGGGKEER